MSTACLGSWLSKKLLAYSNSQNEEDWNTAVAWVKRIAEICGKENLFLETQPSYNKEQIVLINYTSVYL